MRKLTSSRRSIATDLAGDGISAYVSYKIHTKVFGEAFRAIFDYDDFSVIRRFSDFVFLHDQLEQMWWVAI